jgi:FkbM family methyltransferase
MKTIIEVGSNNGNDTANWFSDPLTRVFAFEPTPELALYLKDRFKGNPNYYPMPLAVDLENGWAWFNIAGTGDWGCSSIFDFNPNIHNEWEGRPDFHFTDKCRVPTIRLDTFMTLYGVEEVDYLWIDAQGNDFRVLQSLGDKVRNIKAGKCEAAWSVNLYSGVDNTATSISKWLMERGFKVAANPYNGKEADIHFERI